MAAAASTSDARQGTAPSAVVGQQRSFWVGLGLYLLTLGLYGYAWHYQVYDELRRQFDLGPFPTGRFGLACLSLLFPLDFVLSYAGVELPPGMARPVAVVVLASLFLGLLGQLLFARRLFAGLEVARDRLGIPSGITFGRFLLWNALGVVIAIGPAVAYAKLQDSINEIWERLEAGDVPPGAEDLAAGPAAADRDLVGAPARADDSSEGTLLDCPSCGTQVRVIREPPVQVRCPDCGNTAPYHG